MAIAPEGSTSEYTDRMVRKMEEIMSEIPEVDGYFTAVALPFNGPGESNLGVMFARFKDERDRSVQDIVKRSQRAGGAVFRGDRGGHRFSQHSQGYQRWFWAALSTGPAASRSR